MAGARFVRRLTVGVAIGTARMLVDSTEDDRAGNTAQLVFPHLKQLKQRYREIARAVDRRCSL